MYFFNTYELGDLVLNTVSGLYYQSLANLDQKNGLEFFNSEIFQNFYAYYCSFYSPRIFNHTTIVVSWKKLIRFQEPFVVMVM